MQTTSLEHTCKPSSYITMYKTFAFCFMKYISNTIFHSTSIFCIYHLSRFCVNNIRYWFPFLCLEMICIEISLAVILISNIRSCCLYLWIIVILWYKNNYKVDFTSHKITVTTWFTPNLLHITCSIIIISNTPERSHWYGFICLKKMSITSYILVIFLYLPPVSILHVLVPTSLYTPMHWSLWFPPLRH